MKVQFAPCQKPINPIAIKCGRYLLPQTRRRMKRIASGKYR